MVFTRGSGSSVGGQDRPGLVDDNIHELIAIDVAADVRGSIPEVSRFIKTTMIDLCDEQYATTVEAASVVATGAIAPMGSRG